jgi:hypothetical protein
MYQPYGCKRSRGERLAREVAFLGKISVKWRTIGCTQCYPQLLVVNTKHQPAKKFGTFITRWHHTKTLQFHLYKTRQYFELREFSGSWAQLQISVHCRYYGSLHISSIGMLQGPRWLLLGILQKPISEDLFRLPTRVKAAHREDFSARSCTRKW